MLELPETVLKKITVINITFTKMCIKLENLRTGKYVFLEKELYILTSKTPVSIFSLGHVSWHIVQHCV